MYIPFIVCYDVGNLLNKVRDKHEWCFSDLLPTSLPMKCEWGPFSTKVLSDNIFGYFPLFPLTGNLYLKLLQPTIVMYVTNCYILCESLPYLRTPLICFQVNLCVVFRANPWSAGITSGRDASLSR